MQKRFLRQHVPEARKLKSKFLKTIPRIRTRHARSAADDFHGLFEEVAHEELEEVDGLVEDIAEEIRDLHNLNYTADPEVGCKLSNRDDIVCSNNVFSDKQVWESSRNSVKHQIQRLRAQLNELKQIRKYLRNRRPGNHHLQQGNRKRMLKAYKARSLGDAEICLCDKEARKATERHMLRAERMAAREEKKLARMRRKERKRLKLERKERRKINPKKTDHCKEDVKMNCFSHDNKHWKTAPFWTSGPFCACTNSNNNTYWCVRNVNSTHNYLYCEYVTGMVTYFDLRVDPHQLRNVLHTLTDTEVNYMHEQVYELKEYSAEEEFHQRRRRERKLLIHRKYFRSLGSVRRKKRRDFRVRASS